MIRKFYRGNHTLWVKNLADLGQLSTLISTYTTGGDFIALTGGLGAGKTAFTQYFCKARGFSGKVTSPTFALFNEYITATGKIVHGDLYRLTTEEIEASLWEWESFWGDPNTLTLLEWADKAPALSDRWTWHLDFSSTDTDDEVRQVTIETQNTIALEQLRKEFTACP